MSVYSVAQAKDALPRLINEALAGEHVVITRRGINVVSLNPEVKSKTTIDGRRKAMDQLIAQQAAWGSSGKTSVELLDEMYEESRD
jgi:antitoxin (DNA-binding transcriptional repressor) of toxin-antitoxin stability system